MLNYGKDNFIWGFKKNERALERDITSVSQRQQFDATLWRLTQRICCTLMKKVALILIHCRLLIVVSCFFLFCCLFLSCQSAILVIYWQKCRRFYIGGQQESGYFECTSTDRPLGVRLSPQHYWETSPMYNTERKTVTHFCGLLKMFLFLKPNKIFMKYKAEVWPVKKQNAARGEKNKRLKIL